MNGKTESGGLQVRDDGGWQETLWRAQRIGWLFMLLLIVAALIGATGSGGPLAMARVETPGGTIEYPRIARWQAAARMMVTPPLSATGEYEILLSESLLRSFTLETVSPEPEQVVATPEGHRLTFNLGEPGAPKLLVFHVRAVSPELPTSARVKLGDGQPVRIGFTVLP